MKGGDYQRRNTVSYYMNSLIMDLKINQIEMNQNKCQEGKHCNVFKVLCDVVCYGEVSMKIIVSIQSMLFLLKEPVNA